MNLSVMMTMVAVVGGSRKRLFETIGDIFGRVPGDLEIPLLPVSRWTVLRTVLPAVLRNRRRIRGNVKRLPAFLATAAARGAELMTRIQAASSPTDLTRLWQDELLPYLHECNYMLEAGTKGDGGAFIKVRNTLRKLVGDADTNMLLLATDSGTNQLASLGPLQAFRGRFFGEMVELPREMGSLGSPVIPVTFVNKAKAQRESSRMDSPMVPLLPKLYSLQRLLKRVQKNLPLKAAWEGKRTPTCP